MRLAASFARFETIGLAVAFSGCGAGRQASSSPPPPPGSTTAAMLTSLSSTSVVVGGNGFTLTVSGSNFAPSATVLWNGQSVPTTVVSNQQVTATISASLITSTGIASVTANHAKSIGSNTLQFIINNPAPLITSISPDNAMAGAAPMRLTVNGSNFSGGATVLVDGSPRSTYPTSATQLQTTIAATDLAAARSIAVTVANPDPAAGPSNQVAFTVTPFTPK